MLINQENCQVIYRPNFIDKDLCKLIFQELMRDCDFQRYKMKMYDREVLSPRKMASFGDGPTVYQDYSSIKMPDSWPYYLLPIRERLEKLTGQKYNFVLVNLYQDGNDYIGYHGDKEDSLVENSTIASISLGVERDFYLRHNITGKTTKILLQEGSLLLMKGETQKRYKHSVPKRKRINEPRINLTFRLIK